MDDFKNISQNENQRKLEIYLGILDRVEYIQLKARRVSSFIVSS